MDGIDLDSNSNKLVGQKEMGGRWGEEIWRKCAPSLEFGSVKGFFLIFMGIIIVQWL